MIKEQMFILASYILLKFTGFFLKLSAAILKVDIELEEIEGPIIWQ